VRLLRLLVLLAVLPGLLLPGGGLWRLCGCGPASACCAEPGPQVPRRSPAPASEAPLLARSSEAAASGLPTAAPRAAERPACACRAAGRSTEPEAEAPGARARCDCGLVALPERLAAVDARVHLDAVAAPAAPLPAAWPLPRPSLLAITGSSAPARPPWACRNLPLRI
jgi:hypothetical protein